MTNLPIHIQRFVEETMNIAKYHNIKCKLLVDVDGLDQKTVRFDSMLPVQEIFHDIEKQYPEVGECRDSCNPTFNDIILYTSINQPDLQGWIKLFTPSDDIEDGRWYINVYYDGGFLKLFRKDSGELRQYAIIEMKPVLRSNADPSTIITISNGCPDINESIEVTAGDRIDSVSDEEWERVFYGYSSAIKEVLTDIATSVARRRRSNDGGNAR